MSLSTDIRITLTGHVAFIQSVGMIRAITALQPALIQEYQCSVTEISLFTGVLLAGCSLSALLAGYVYPKHGIRKPMAVCAITVVVGLCLFSYTMTFKSIYLSAIILLIFVGAPLGLSLAGSMVSARLRGRMKYIGRIMTFQGAGVSIGAFLLPTLYKIALDATGLQMTFYIIAASQAVGLFLALQIPEDPNHKIESSKKDEHVKLTTQTKVKPKLISVKLLKQRSFMLYAVTNLFFLGGYFGILPLMKPLLLSIGLPPKGSPHGLELIPSALRNNSILQLEDNVSEKLLSYMGFVEVIARFIFAMWIVDSPRRMTLMSYTLLGDAIGLGLVMLALVYPGQTFWIVFTSFTIAGFFNAGFGGLMNAVLVDITDKNNYSVAIGMNTMIMGIGMVSGPLIASGIVDIVGAGCESPYEGGECKPYWLAVLFGSIAMAISSVISYLITLLYMKNGEFMPHGVKEEIES